MDACLKLFIHSSEKITLDEAAELSVSFTGENINGKEARYSYANYFGDCLCYMLDTKLCLVVTHKNDRSRRC